MSSKPLLIDPTFRRRDDRGTLTEVVRAGPWETVLTGRMRAGAVMGHHYHDKTDMVFHVIAGSAVVGMNQVDSGRSERVEMQTGDILRIERRVAHVIRFMENTTFVLLKSRPYDESDRDTFDHHVSDELPD